MPNPISGLALAQESMKHGPGADEYWRTVEENVVRYAIFAYPFQTGSRMSPQYHDFLQSASGALDHRLAPDALRYNLALANKGDAEGQFLMGKRYRDGMCSEKCRQTQRIFLPGPLPRETRTAAQAWDEMTASVPMNLIKVTVSSQYSPEQAARHLVDRSGMRDKFPMTTTAPLKRCGRPSQNPP